MSNAVPQGSLATIALEVILVRRRRHQTKASQHQRTPYVRNRSTKVLKDCSARVCVPPVADLLDVYPQLVGRTARRKRTRKVLLDALDQLGAGLVRDVVQTTNT